MASEIKKVEGHNVVVEIITTQQRDQQGNTATVERVQAFTESQIDQNIATLADQKLRWQAMKDLLTPAE
jgi:hypothetical protein